MSGADELDAAINDPSEWEQPKRAPRSEKRRRDAVVSVRMTQEELETIQNKATRAHQTVGTFIREAALSDAGAHLVCAWVTPTSQCWWDARDSSPASGPDLVLHTGQIFAFYAAQHGWSKALTGGTEAPRELKLT